MAIVSCANSTKLELKQYHTGYTYLVIKQNPTMFLLSGQTVRSFRPNIINTVIANIVIHKKGLFSRSDLLKFMQNQKF